jgi:hypothetical protein
MRYFKLEEFACPCCGLKRIDPKLLVKLDDLRHECGIPFHINSGCRCNQHNKDVGGVDSSSHTIQGDGFTHAVDIRCKTSRDRYTILLHVYKYFNRVGIAKTFIHVDNDASKSQHVTWVY